MKTDIDPIAEAFRAVYDAMVDTAPTGPTWDEITAAPAPLDPAPIVGPSEPKRRVRWRRPAVTAAAAGAATLLLVGGIAVVLRSWTDPVDPAGSIPPGSSISQTPADSTEPTVAIAPAPSTPGNWTRVNLDLSTFSLGFEDIAVGPDGFVAVGLPGAGTSPDGVTWHLASTDVAAIQIASGDGKYVAFDRSGTGAALWASPDGTTWTRTRLDEAVFTLHDEITAVVFGSGGYVAVGADDPANGEDSPVWTSRDGATWTRVPLDSTVFGGEMLDVAHGDDRYVAVGRASNDSGWAEAAVWTSLDGRTWARVPNENGLFGGVGGHVMYGITFGDGRYVAVGVEGDADVDFLGWRAAVWTSADGVNWTRVPHDEEAFGLRDSEGAAGMESVAYGEAGYMAVGDTITADGETQTAALWYSSDGTTWQRVPHDEAVFGGDVGLNAIAVIGSNWLAVGREVAISWIW